LKGVTSPSFLQHSYLFGILEKDVPVIFNLQVHTPQNIGQLTPLLEKNYRFFRVI